ncbi:MAG: GntR family transcriptional regulator [Alphaproteobacteria bacterium]|jgi:DNA-binding GntR family transcriptional regulator|nr:GntR family transcriptional regulator [Alphaproteobacteria bacterium]
MNQQVETADSLTRRAYRQIEEMIVTLALAPGATVSEGALAESLGMSRTPVREALQKLAREGLVRVMPRRGLLITEFDVGRQLRMLDVRRQIDRLLATRAASRRTPQQAEGFRAVAAEFAEAARQNDDTLFTRADRAFNDLIVAAAGNEFAAEAASLTQGLSRRFWYAHHERFSEIGEAADFHRAIALAIAEGDEDAAGAASDALLDHVEAFTRATL